MPSFTACVLGATGAVGSALVRNLLDAPSWSRVVTIGRRGLEGVSSDKLVQHKVDMEKVGEDLFVGCDVTFCALGTTRADAGSAEAFRHIDFDLVAISAAASKAAGQKHFFYVSSERASADSWFLYPKTKGEVENHLKTLRFDNLEIFRPGLLDRGDKARTVEKLAAYVMATTSVTDVALAMRVEAEKALGSSGGGPSVTTFSNSDILAIAAAAKKGGKATAGAAGSASNEL